MKGSHEAPLWASNRPARGRGASFFYGSSLLVLIIGSMAALLFVSRDIDRAHDAGLQVENLDKFSLFVDRWLLWVILSAILLVGGYAADLLEQQRVDQRGQVEPTEASSL